MLPCWHPGHRLLLSERYQCCLYELCPIFSVAKVAIQEDPYSIGL